MNQSQLNHAVARATGESVSTIQHLGFHMLGESNTEVEDSLDKETLLPGPRVYDWDIERAVQLADLMG
jgi:hypothetical protein